MKTALFPRTLLVASCLGLCALGVGCRPKPQEQVAAPASPRAVPAPVIQDPVHITRTGKAYHRAGCRYLDASDYVEGRKDAIAQGLTPCKVCDPAAPVKDPTVHVTRSGKAYHKAGCTSLDRSDFTEPLSRAIGQGLHACPKCGG
jgi:hypothetical protein